MARPTEAALTSWLIREAEVAEELAAAPGSDVGTVGDVLGIPLRHDGSTAGYVVLVFDPQLPRHVELALKACVDDLTRALTVPAAGPAGSRDRLRHLAAVG